MAKISKSLSAKVSKQTGKSEILLRFIGGYRLEFKTKSGIFVNPKQWNFTKNELKTATFGNEQAEVKIKLDSLCNTIIDTFTSTEKAQVTKEWLNTIIDKFHFPEKYAPKEEVVVITLFQYIDSFITSAPERKDKKTGRLLTRNNIQQYNATYKHLRAFAKKQRKVDYQFSDIDPQFYDNFVAFLQAQNFTLNSVGKHVRILKLMLGEATVQGINTNLQYQKFHVFTEDVDNVYLSEDELSQIQNTDFSSSPCFDRVRDWFLLLAWTGCRFSDLIKIGKTDIKDDMITFRQQKTNTKVTIPLHPVVKEVLDKYNYNLPEPISNQRFNEYIKEVCKIAGLTSAETTTRTVGKQLVTEKFEKWELVTSHTGRRSFCTNMYKRGLPALMIMSISGHKTEKSFLKYIKVSQSEHAAMMQQAWSKMYNK